MFAPCPVARTARRSPTTKMALTTRYSCKRVEIFYSGVIVRGECSGIEPGRSVRFDLYVFSFVQIEEPKDLIGKRLDLLLTIPYAHGINSRRGYGRVRFDA